MLLDINSNKQKKKNSAFLETYIHINISIAKTHSKKLLTRLQKYPNKTYQAAKLPIELDIEAPK